MMKIVTLFGTRPEAIKMAPLVKALEKDPDIQCVTCVTGQHREMLDQVLDVFQIKPQYDLNLMKHGQTLGDITTGVMSGVEDVLKKENPDLVLVHGDTTTTFAGALAAFYHKIPVGHVEAGLRTGNVYSPYPEEMNRLLTSRLATIHFAATRSNVENLLNEGVHAECIYQTGNTVIDALKSVIDSEYSLKGVGLPTHALSGKKIICVTVHRRENWGEPMENIFRALRQIADDFEDTVLVYPVHMNPRIKACAHEHLGNHDRIFLIPALEYVPFANLMAKAHLLVTDSGGIQEEAPSLGVPVVVVRTETERPEAIMAGTVVVAGVERDSIYSSVSTLLKDDAAYQAMATAVNPYGDGKACERIIDIIKTTFLKA